MGSHVEDGYKLFDGARKAVREYGFGDLEKAALMALVDARENFILAPSDETLAQITSATEALEVFCVKSMNVLEAHNRINMEILTELDFAENGDQ